MGNSCYLTQSLIRQQFNLKQRNKLLNHAMVHQLKTVPQETEVQEDLRKFLTYYNNQQSVEVTKLLENTVSEFSEHFKTFCSLQKEQLAEQKLIWDQSILNLTNLQFPKELIKKST